MQVEVYGEQPLLLLVSFLHCPVLVDQDPREFLQEKSKPTLSLSESREGEGEGEGEEETDSNGTQTASPFANYTSAALQQVSLIFPLQ